LDAAPSRTEVARREDAVREVHEKKRHAGEHGLGNGRRPRPRPGDPADAVYEETPEARGDQSVSASKISAAVRSQVKVSARSRAFRPIVSDAAGSPQRATQSIHHGGCVVAVSE
jgi:hypothetical protein